MRINHSEMLRGAAVLGDGDSATGLFCTAGVCDNAQGAARAAALASRRRHREDCFIAMA
jgi:hypothetical protein